MPMCATRRRRTPGHWARGGGPIGLNIPLNLRFIRIFDGVDLDHPLESAKGRPVFERHGVAVRRASPRSLVLDRLQGGRVLLPGRHDRQDEHQHQVHEDERTGREDCQEGEDPAHRGDVEIGICRQTRADTGDLLAFPDAVKATSDASSPAAECGRSRPRRVGWRAAIALRGPLFLERRAARAAGAALRFGGRHAADGDQDPEQVGSSGDRPAGRSVGPRATRSKRARG